MFYSALLTYPTHCLLINYDSPQTVTVYHHEYTSMWQMVLVAKLSQRGPEAQRPWWLYKP